MIKIVNSLLVGLFITSQAFAVAEGPDSYVRTENLNIQKKNWILTSIGTKTRFNINTGENTLYLLRFWKQKNLFFDSFCLDTLRIRDLNAINELNKDLEKSLEIKYTPSPRITSDDTLELTIRGKTYKSKREQETPNIWAYPECEW